MIYFISANEINIGDVLSTLGIQKLLGVQGMNLYCDRQYIEHTKKAIRDSQSNDVFIIGGGGLLKDYFMPFWNEIYRNRKRLRYVLWGIGFCDRKRFGLKQFFSEKLLTKTVFLKKWRSIVKHSMISSFRDENTYRYFKHIHNTFKIGCPSINYILDYKRDLPKTVLINSCHQFLLNHDEAEAIQKITDMLANNLGLKKVYTNRMVTGWSDLYALLRLYSSADITVSSSLHGCILALSLGSKLLAVSRDWKIEGFLQMVDLIEALCDIDEIEKRATNFGSQKDVSKRIEKISKENVNFAQEVKILITSKSISL